MPTTEKCQECSVIDVKFNTLNENLRDLSITVKEQFSEVRTRLDALQLQSQTNSTLLRLVVGDGEPGHGRLGLAETTIENLKRYFWQIAGGVAVILLLIEVVFKIAK